MCSLYQLQRLIMNKFQCDERKIGNSKRQNHSKTLWLQGYTRSESNATRCGLGSQSIITFRQLTKFDLCLPTLSNLNQLLLYNML